MKMLIKLFMKNGYGKQNLLFAQIFAILLYGLSATWKEELYDGA